MTATASASQKVDTRRKALGRGSLERIIFAGMFTKGVNDRWGLPYCLVGKPGTAKTSTNKQIADMAGLFFKGVVSSLRDPTDFLGLGVPSHMKLGAHNQHLSPDGDDSILTMKYAPANFAIEVALAKRALLLLDEVNTTAPAVQAALLRLLFEGVCGELELPPGVRMMLAMNHTEDAAGGWEIAPPLANRIGWLEWPTPDPDRFTEFLMGAGGAKVTPINAAAEEAEVEALWPAAWAKAAGQVAGFIKAKGVDALFKMPSNNSKQVSSAWPSPRTWELATRAKAGSFIYDLTDREADTSISAFIGSGAAGELHTWVRNNDLPDPTDFLDGLVQFDHNPRRLDRTAAVLTAATSLVVSGAGSAQMGNAQQNAKRAETLWQFHQKLADQAPDLSLASVVSLCKARLMIGSGTAYKVLSKMEPVMQAAGITPGNAP